MGNWTPEEYAMVVERVDAKIRRVQAIPSQFLEDEPDPGPESELASKIVKHATGQGWPHIYFPRTKKVRFFLPPGWPDLVIAIPQGRTIFLETKAASGELRKKQTLMANMFRYLGHEYEKCKSFKRYLQITERKRELLDNECRCSICPLWIDDYCFKEIKCKP